MLISSSFVLVNSSDNPKRVRLVRRKCQRERQIWIWCLLSFARRCPVEFVRYGLVTEVYGADADFRCGFRLCQNACEPK